MAKSKQSLNVQNGTTGLLHFLDKNTLNKIYNSITNWGY